MADVLTVIREYNVNKMPMEEAEELAVFGDKAWPKNAKTNYVAYGTGTDTVAKEYYTVDCILFLLKNVHLPHAMYVRQAAQTNVPVVRRPDRKNLLAYLNGETATSQSIDKSAPLEISQTAPKKDTHKRAAEPEQEPNNKRQRLEQVQRDKQRLAAKLDAPKSNLTHKHPSSTDEKSTLPAMLSKEKIAAIKAKVLSTKRSKINIEDEPVSAFERGSFVDAEVAVTQDIISRERLWRTRTSILQSNGKQFAQNIFGILATIKAREEGRHSSQPITNIKTINQSSRAPQTTYNRYAQEELKRKEDTDEFRIDVTKTFQGASLKSVTEGHVAQKKPAVANKPAVMEAPPSNKRTSRTPIIVIPASTTSLIQMINAKDILQDLRYVSAEQKKAEGKSRDNEVLLQIKRNTQTVPYRVIDNVLKLSPHDWDRVVAVFAQGPAWQFKAWPWGGNPVEIFSKMKAFHIQTTDMTIEANIKKWDITILRLDRNKRHLDRAILQEFWSVLDRFTQKNKNHLRI